MPTDMGSPAACTNGEAAAAAAAAAAAPPVGEDHDIGQVSPPPTKMVPPASTPEAGVDEAEPQTMQLANEEDDDSDIDL